MPSKFPYILNGTVSEDAKKAPEGTLKGNSSYVYHTYQHDPEPVPGHGGTFRKIDSRNFPISQTIAAAIVELEPKGLRELHWHPNVSYPQPLIIALSNSKIIGARVALLPPG